MLDVGVVLYRRLRAGAPLIGRGDRLHLHFLLLDTGVPYGAVIGIFYAWSLIFGGIALFIGDDVAIWLLLAQVFIASVVYGVVARRAQRRPLT
jgi:hypothetical protein